MSSNDLALEVYQIECRGSVQGIGARPRIAILARELGVAGVVFNDLGGVKVIFASSLSVAQGFVESLRGLLGESVVIRVAPYDELALTAKMRQVIIDRAFEIISSSEVDNGLDTPVDQGICESCMAEIGDKNHPRYQYLLNACSQCGPRYSVLQQMPFDRTNTTLANFSLCESCTASYSDPQDRRYHSQLIGCQHCGPQYWLKNKLSDSVTKSSAQILDQVCALLTANHVIAIKGVGGFHFCCRADNPQAVEKIRHIKKRPTKPLAIMGELAQLKPYADLSLKALELLQQPARPIVITPKNHQELKGVAPGLDRIGVMLPNTALHVLIFQSVDFPIVMTSANLSGGPLISDYKELDSFDTDLSAVLTHDRDIEHPIDDAVIQIGNHDHWQLLRLGRGFAPRVFDFKVNHQKTEPINDPCFFAVGADLKNTFAFVRWQQLYLSQYLGDLKNADVLDRYELEVNKTMRMHRVLPNKVVKDQHPDYQSTKFASEVIERVSGQGQDLEFCGIDSVQHHHAHAVSVMVEHGLSLKDDYAAIVMDGLGWGDTHCLWGGELLLVNGCRFKRLSHLRPFPLLGGSLAARQPWRNSLVLTQELPDKIQRHWRANLNIPKEKRTLVDAAQKLLDRQQPLQASSGLNEFATSSVGRLFDGIAALLGFPVFEIDYEGQAAIWLQQLAQSSDPSKGKPYERSMPEGDEDPQAPIDWSVFFLKHCADMIERPVELENRSRLANLANLFHHWLVDAYVTKLLALARSNDSVPKKVLLSGGVMQNQYLLRLFIDKLSNAGFETYSSQVIPANDEGIAVGQVAVAATRYYADSC